MYSVLSNWSGCIGLLLLVLPVWVEAQEPVIPLDSLLATIPPDSNGVHIRIFQDRFESVDLDDGSTTVHPTPGLGGFIPGYEPVITRNGFFLVKETGGLVYQVLPSGIRRIDNSYDHRLQSNGIIFSRNDTIFIHGGYGFWSTRNLLIYFDNETREWELYHTDPRTEVAPSLVGHQFFLSGDSLVVIGGWEMDPVNALVMSPSNTVWWFSFTEKRWRRLGELRMKDFEYIRHRTPVLRTPSGEWQVSHPLALVLNEKEGTIRKCRCSQELAYLHFSWNIVPFFYKDRFYFYEHPPKSDHPLSFSSIPVSKYFRECAEALPLFQSRMPQWFSHWPWLAASMAGFVFAWLFARKKYASKLSEDQETDPVFHLDASERKLLTAFLSRFPKALLVQEVDSALETTLKSRDVQNQRRSQVIRSVNSKYMILMASDAPVILSRRSELDGRMIEYYIDPEGHERLRSLVAGK